MRRSVRAARDRNKTHSPTSRLHSRVSGSSAVPDTRWNITVPGTRTAQKEEKRLMTVTSDSEKENRWLEQLSDVTGTQNILSFYSNCTNVPGMHAHLVFTWLQPRGITISAGTRNCHDRICFCLCLLLSFSFVPIPLEKSPRHRSSSMHSLRELLLDI